MKKLFLYLLIILMSLVPFRAHAQEDGLELKLTRDFGYGGFAGDIQGKFSLRASGPDNLVEVRFMIDGAVFATANQVPFNHQFETNQFPPGQHTLTAVGILSDGTQIKGPEFTRVFLSDEEASQATRTFVMPLLIGFGVVALLSIALPLVFSRKNKYQLKQYGIAGGAVCSRCNLPFSRSLLAPNMLFGKLERCPHCGKWAIVQRATPQELEAAENRYMENETNLQLNPEKEKEKLRKALDETRYE